MSSNHPLSNIIHLHPNPHLIIGHDRQAIGVLPIILNANTSVTPSSTHLTNKMLQENKGLEELERNVNVIKNVTDDIRKETEIHNAILKEMVDENLDKHFSYLENALRNSNKTWSRCRFVTYMLVFLFLFWLLLKLKKKLFN